MTYSVNGPSFSVASGADFTHQGWIKDMDEWISSVAPYQIGSYGNYSTAYLCEWSSCQLRQGVSPNPTIARPEAGKNVFTWFVKAVTNSSNGPITYYDRFQPMDQGGSLGPNGTRDKAGLTQVVAATVAPAMAGGGG